MRLKTAHSLSPTLTYPSFAFNVVQLPLGAFADTLGAPQLDADAHISERHRTDGQEVCQKHVRHVVAGLQDVELVIILRNA